MGVVLEGILFVETLRGKVGQCSLFPFYSPFGCLRMKLSSMELDLQISSSR